MLAVRIKSRVHARMHANTTSVCMCVCLCLRTYITYLNVFRAKMQMLPTIAAEGVGGPSSSLRTIRRRRGRSKQVEVRKNFTHYFLYIFFHENLGGLLSRCSCFYGCCCLTLLLYIRYTTAPRVYIRIQFIVFAPAFTKSRLSPREKPITRSFIWRGVYVYIYYYFFLSRRYSLRAKNSPSRHHHHRLPIDP